MLPDLILIAGSLVLGIWLWRQWYLTLVDAPPGKKPRFMIYFLMIVPIICLTIIWMMLSGFAASDVRGNTFYMFEYLALGFAWLAAAEWFFKFMGVSTVYDFLDRRNNAAFSAITGALLGVTFCYIGSNIGEGPGFYVVIFCAALATLSFLVLWWLLVLITQVDYTVTVDRDPAAGLRLGGFLVAAGLILGRAAAGNWVSYQAASTDMLVFGLPAVAVLLIVAIVVESLARPTVQRPAPVPLLLGLAPMAFYIIAAAFYVVLRGFPA